MVLELRPTWCVDDEMVDAVMRFGRWEVDGKSALDRHGDDWQPGERFSLTRSVELTVEPVELRRMLGLATGQVVGVAARWACRATSNAGVHVGGPNPTDLQLKETLISLELPVEVAGSIEIETCLIVRQTSSKKSDGSTPDGSILWSDGWTQPSHERSMLLEGSEARIPVRSVSFRQHFGEASSALWAIDLDPSISLDDLTANVVTILLNKDRTAVDFRGSDDEPDVSLIPSSLIAGMNVDLVRSLSSTLIEELMETEWASLRDLDALEDGSVGKLLGIHLIRTFGSVDVAVATLDQDVPAFDRRMWDLFAPKSWSKG